jgi:hypothetical protein
MSRWKLYLPVCLLTLPLLVYLLAASGPAGFDRRPTALPNVPPVADADALPDAARMEDLARTDSVAFLENCLRRQAREVKGYHLLMQKQERLGGTLHPRELVEVHFKEQPHSVLLIWKEGARKAERALYVEGENNGKMLARPYGRLAQRIAGEVVERDVDGPDARQSGRFTLDQYGLRKATERYYAAWKAAHDKGTLNVEYKGIAPLPEAGGKRCYQFHRLLAEPENDGVFDQTLFMYEENWLMAGSVVMGVKGQLIGEYYFRDIELNPEFKPGQFTREALVPK